MSTEIEKLFTKNFILITASSLFSTWTLYIVLTIFPIFLMNKLMISESISGIILALFPFGALICRPLAGWLSDSFSLKHTTLWAYLGLLITGFGYFIFSDIIMLSFIRLAQGFCFSIASTALSTLAIRVIPERKLGTGLGIYSANFSLAMILGPMTGFYILDLFSKDLPDSSIFAFQMVFVSSIIFTVIGIALILFFTDNTGIKPQKVKFSKDNIILKTGFSATICLFFLAFIYAIILNYVAIFSIENGFGEYSAYFFLFMGVGLIISRSISGYIYDKGYMIHQTIIANIFLMILSTIFSTTEDTTIFLLTALGLGFTFGTLIPTMQTLLVQFAKPTERGLASSTYFIAFDIASILAVFIGGIIIEHFSVETAFLFATSLQVIALSIFIFRVIPDYKAIKK